MSGIVQSSKARVLIASLGALLATPSVGSAQSTDYPSQRISFIVGFAVGGFADTIGRWVAIRLGERTGQTVVVQNMEGGGGVRAARRVAMSPPDGYTILVTTTSLTINESLVPNRGYTATAFDAVSLPVSAPESLSASVKSPIKSLADLVNEAKAGTVFMGSAGIGSGSHRLWRRRRPRLLPHRLRSGHRRGVSTGSWHRRRHLRGISPDQRSGGHRAGCGHFFAARPARPVVRVPCLAPHVLARGVMSGRRPAHPIH